MHMAIEVRKNKHENKLIQFIKQFRSSHIPLFIGTLAGRSVFTRSFREKCARTLIGWMR